MPFLVAPPPKPPINVPSVASPIILFLLFSILLCAATDLSFALLNNLGLTSFFLGLVAASATITHILTNLFIILYRVRRGGSNQNTTRSSAPLWDWELLPPTSKVSSIIMSLMLTVLFTISFVITLLLHFIHYFGGANSVDSTFRRNSSPLKGSKAVLYADAFMELLCGILLGVLSLIGWRERKQFQERRIPLGDG